MSFGAIIKSSVDRAAERITSQLQPKSGLERLVDRRRRPRSRIEQAAEPTPRSRFPGGRLGALAEPQQPPSQFQAQQEQGFLGRFAERYPGAHVPPLGSERIDYRSLQEQMRQEPLLNVLPGRDRFVRWLQPYTGRAGEEFGRYALSRRGGMGTGIVGLPGDEESKERGAEVGRAIGEFAPELIPRYWEELLIEAVPGVGWGPDIARVSRRLLANAPDAARTSRTVAKEFLESPTAQRIIHEERGALELGGEAVEQPSQVGHRFAGDLRPIDDVQTEIVTSENPLTRAAIGRTGINPSIRRTDDVAKYLTAYERQQVAADELSNLATMLALDVHGERGTGRLPFSMTKGGRLKNVPIPEGRSANWNDVFSYPDRYNLTPKQRAYVDDLHKLIDEVEELRVAWGLKPRARRGPEGWFYVPRQVKGIRGIEIERPSNPSLQRLWEDAQEGVEAGIKYENDPRSVVELHVRSAYREIVNKQLSDALEPLSVTAREMVPKKVVSRMEAATRVRQSAERAFRKEMYQHPRETAHPARVAAKERLSAARNEYESAKNVYRREIEIARKKEVAPGNLWGPNQPDEIPVAQWRNRFFPREQARLLNENLGAFRKPGQTQNWIGGGFEILGNHIRFLGAVGDFAAPFIQGLTTIISHPILWGRATWKHYVAFGDPTVQARFAREYADELHEMARFGSPTGDPEFYAAIEAAGPGLGTVVRKTRTGETLYRQTFGRFQASYNSFNTANRALLTRAFRKTIPDAAERQQTVRNLTGGLNSKALGVTPNQRGVEGTWMAFSPRLLRSTVALIADVRRGPFDPVGREAIKSLGSLAAGVTGIYISTGLLLGKSEQEIRTGLNPLSGKKFLSHEINGDWIGVGGQVRAITQLLVRSIADPQSLTETDEFENPLLSFFASRGAPGMTIGRTLIEGTTGLDAQPYEEIDGWPDIAKHLGKSALPFTLQGLIEGEQPLTAGFALAGLRTSPGTFTERGQRAVEEAGGDFRTAYRVALEAGDEERAEQVQAAWRRELKPKIEELGFKHIPGAPGRAPTIEAPHIHQRLLADPAWAERFSRELAIDITGAKDLSDIRRQYIEEKQAALAARDGITLAEARRKLGNYFDTSEAVAGSILERNRDGSVRKRADDGYRDFFQMHWIYEWQQHPDLYWDAVAVGWEQDNETERELIPKP